MSVYRIEFVEWFVVDQQFWLVCNCLGDLDLLVHIFGVFVDLVVYRVGYVDSLQSFFCTVLGL